MISLSWEQVNGWRLAQQRVQTRAASTDWLAVVQQIGGLQAQVFTAAELALAARVEGLAPDTLTQALWHARTLVKSWLMRGTLHIVAAQDYPRCVAALGTLRHFERASWRTYHSITSDELTAILEGIPALLSDQGHTREQLATALAERAGNPALHERLRSGWGALLKPSSLHGTLCYGPGIGQSVTFVRPDAWLGAWEPHDPQEALHETARRFLATYGPATADEFGRWFGFETSAAKRVWRALEPELAAVSVEGWESWALHETLPALQAATPAHGVRLLPHFDPYTIAVSRQSQRWLTAAQRGRIYRAQGWIYPVVLVDGQMAGFWEHKPRRGTLTITVTLFAPPADPARQDALAQGLEAEAQRIGAFRGLPVQVVQVAE